MALEFRFHSWNAPCEQSKGSGAPWAGPWSGPRRPRSLPRECARAPAGLRALSLAANRPGHQRRESNTCLSLCLGKTPSCVTRDKPPWAPRTCGGHGEPTPIHVSRAFQTPRRARFLSGTSLCLQLPAEHKKKCFHVRIPDSMRVESKEAILDSSSIMCSVDTNRHRCNVQ